MNYLEKIRTETIQLHGLEDMDMDKQYTFYYDETNNPRTFKITENGFNFDERNFFVLGGLVFIKENKPKDSAVDHLFKQIGGQEIMQEVKFKHIQQKSKDFLFLINKYRVRDLINWIDQYNLWIHYSFLDNFYYSIVDIVDTLEESYYLGPEFLREIKNELYLVIKGDKNEFLDILRKNSYPEIPNHREFITDIINWLEEKSYNDIFLIEYFRQSLKSYRNKKLVLLKGNEPFITIGDYTSLYEHRLFTFLYSTHVLDKEEIVEAKIKAHEVNTYKQKFGNYEFIDSKTNRFIQLSDMIVGIIRMWLSYLEKSTIREMERDFASLRPHQLHTLQQWNRIMIRSLAENRTFKHGIAHNDFERKVSFFLDYFIV